MIAGGGGLEGLHWLEEWCSAGHVLVLVLVLIVGMVDSRRWLIRLTSAAIPLSVDP